MSEDAAAGTRSPIEAVPSLAELLLGVDLDRVLAVLDPRCSGFGLFEENGKRIAGEFDASSALVDIDELPRELIAGLASSLDYSIQPLVVAARTIGAVVLGRVEGFGPDDREEACRRIAVTINEMLRARYVAWVGGRIQMRAAQLNYETMVQNEADIERAVDQLHDLDRLKSNFLGLVSHELRTPLTSIIGFAEMLTEGVAGPLNEKQQSHAETVLARAEQLQKLVSRVIEAAELEFEPVHLDLHALSLRQIVDRAWNELKYDAARAGKSLRNDVPADLEGLIDGGKLLIVVTNLLDNAIKFSVGDKHIAVNAERAPLRRSLAEADPFGEEEAAAILVTIRNQTQGLAPDQLKKIFEIFRQGDLQLTRAQGGLGLGLAVADRIVRAHGGEIWAELSGESDLAVRFTIPPGNAV